MSLTFQKQTALHMAALKGHSETCKVLIECDASMDAYDEQGLYNIFRNTQKQNAISICASIQVKERFIWRL